MSNLPKTENILLEEDDGWLTIWFNRPDNRNALSKELTTELKATLKAVRDDRSIRGITLRGKGGIFCAGGDLKGFKSNYQGGTQTEADVAAASREGGLMFDLINEMPQVVVILVEGAAMAGGLGMVCTADAVAVTKDAKFSMTETTLGIPPAQIAPFVAQRLGLRTARRLMVTAARFDGEEAGRLGQGIVLATRHLDRDAMLDFAAAGFAECMLSDEGREGVASFLEKRKPVWSAK
jgi:isohexenylglutaconyl-CoA hydratase